MDSEHAEPSSGEPFAAEAGVAGGDDGVAAVDRFLADLWA